MDPWSSDRKSARSTVETSGCSVHSFIRVQLSADAPGAGDLTTGWDCCAPRPANAQKPAAVAAVTIRRCWTNTRTHRLRANVNRVACGFPEPCGAWLGLPAFRNACVHFDQWNRVQLRRFEKGPSGTLSAGFSLEPTLARSFLRVFEPWAPCPCRRCQCADEAQDENA